MKTVIIILVIIAVAGGIVLFLRKRTGSRSDEKPKFSDEEYERHYEAKQAALERILGTML